MGHSAVPPEEYHAVWQGVAADLMWLPGRGRVERAASALAGEKVEAIKVCVLCFALWVGVRGVGRVGRPSFAFAKVLHACTHVCCCVS